MDQYQPNFNANRHQSWTQYQSDYQGQNHSYSPHPQSINSATSNNNEIHKTIDENKAPGGKFYCLKAFAGKAAVGVYADRTRAGVHTIRLEAAPGANKNFQWDNKITIQVTHTDLLKFIATFNFMSEGFEFNHYGQNNDKQLQAKVQKGGVFLQVKQRSTLLNIPITAGDAILMGHLALEQYLKNNPSLQSQTVLHTIGNALRRQLF